MDNNKAPKIIIGVLLLMVAAAAVYQYASKPSVEPPNPDKGSIYYTGAFRSKGDPNKYFTADGKEVPASEVEGKSPGGAAAGPAPNGGVGAGVQGSQPGGRAAPTGPGVGKTD